MLSIVITTRNRKDILLRCIESIRKSNLIDINYEIIVVDDNSNDGTQDLEAKDFGKLNISFIHSTSQQMMTKSRNIGAKKAKGDYILFVDDDNVLHVDMIRILYEFGRNNPDFGMLGPSMYLYHNRKKYLDFQSINLFTSKTTAHVISSPQIYFESDGIPNVFMIKKEAFERVGYFDEEIIQSYTEPEFAFRARVAKYRCAIVNHAITYHDVVLESDFAPRNMGGMFYQKAYCLIRNRSILVFRYGKWYHKTIYLICFSWVWPCLYSFFMLRYRRFDLIRLYWKGYKDGIYFAFTGKIRTSI